MALEKWALAVWGRARYLSVTEASQIIEFYDWVGKKHFDSDVCRRQNLMSEVDPCTEIVNNL